MQALEDPDRKEDIEGLTGVEQRHFTVEEAQVSITR